LSNSKPIYTPLPVGIDFSAIHQPQTPGEKEEAAALPYRELIGSLMFAATVSCPDIAYSVNKLAQYSSNPGRGHWELAKRILRYLFTTRARELKLGGEWLMLNAYCDADFAGDTDDRKSVGGYAVFFGVGAVSWSSRKQPTVALSSTEAEYIALSEAAREVKWVRSFLEELGIKNDLPTTIYEDNQAAIAYATTQRTLRRMKHIDVKYHFTRHLIETGIIKLEYKSTEHMVADIFTKPLPISIHLYLTEELGLHYPRLEESVEISEPWRMWMTIQTRRRVRVGGTAAWEI
jgi:hypothetical protein